MISPLVGKQTRMAKKLDEVVLSEVGAEQSAAFAQMAGLVQRHGEGLPTATRLRLYALYKQALTGDAPEDPPSAAGWDVAAKLKWKAWVELRGPRAWP